MSGRWLGDVRAKLYGYDPAASGVNKWTPLNASHFSSSGTMSVYNAVEDDTAPASGLMMMGESRSGPKSAMSADGDATRVVTDEYGHVVTADFNWTNRVGKVQEQAPIYDHYQGETLADETNGTDGTYYYYLDWASYRYGGLQFVLNGGSGSVTVTVEATLQDDGTDPASCSYEDVTNDLFGVASFTASDMAIISNPVPFKYLRIKVVASTGGANDADWTVYSRRAF